MSLCKKAPTVFTAEALCILAGATGLEPATFGVTGRRSNQLNYAPKSYFEFQIVDFRFKFRNPGSAFRNLLVGGTGIEPVTSGL